MGSIQNALQAYVFYNDWRVMFEIIGKCDQGSSLQLHDICNSEYDRVVAVGNTEDRVMTPEDFERSEAIDKALWHVAFLIFSELHPVAQHLQFYMLKDDKLEDCSELTKCQRDRGRLPVVFSEVSLRAMDASRVTNPEGSSIQVVEVEK